jgi:hypothetical protein
VGKRTRDEALGILVRQKQNRVQLEHRRDLEHRRPKEIVEGADGRDLAAEGVEFGGCVGARASRHDLRTSRGGEITDDHRDEREEKERDDIFGIGDGEGVERRDEEEIEGEHAQHRREQRWP